MALKRREELDTELVVRRLLVLEGIEGSDITQIKTDTVRAHVEASAARADLALMHQEFSSGGFWSPVEKKLLYKQWKGFEAEYPVIRARAISTGLSESSASIIAYTDAYSDLETMLLGVDGLLVDLGTTSIVDPVEVDQVYFDYLNTRELLLTGSALSITYQISALLVKGNLTPIDKKTLVLIWSRIFSDVISPPGLGN